MFHSDLQGVVTEQVTTIAHAAATATEYVGSWEAPKNIKLISVEWRPSAAITGADTNTTHLNLDDAGTGGAGTTELGNIDYTDGVNAAAGEVESFYAPSSPAEYSEGNLFKLQAEKVGNGIAIPSGVLIFKYYNN